MAEAKKTETKASADPGGESKTETETPTARSTGRGGAGEYVVIGDQVILPGADGKGHVTHRRGARVALTADQAIRFVSGTRPVLVAASRVKDSSPAAVTAALRVEIARAAKERAKRRGGNR